MLNSIIFNSDEQTFHEDMLSNCEKQCGTILAHPNTVERNETKCLDLTVTQLLQQFSAQWHLFTAFKSKQLELVSSAQQQLNNQKLNQLIRICQIKSMTYCTYLAQALNYYNPNTRNHDENVMSEYRGYFLLLAAILSYNLANDENQLGKSDTAVPLIVSAFKWMEDFELNHLHAIYYP